MIRKLLIPSVIFFFGTLLVCQTQAQAQTKTPSSENASYNFSNSDVQEIAVSDDSTNISVINQEIDQVAITTHATFFENIFNNGFTQNSSSDSSPVDQTQQPAATLPQTTGSGGGATIITPDPGHVFASAIAPMLPNATSNLTFLATIIAFLIFFAGFGLRLYSGSSPPFKFAKV